MSLSSCATAPKRGQFSYVMEISVLNQTTFYKSCYDSTKFFWVSRSALLNIFLNDLISSDVVK